METARHDILFYLFGKNRGRSELLPAQWCQEPFRLGSFHANQPNLAFLNMLMLGHKPCDFRAEFEKSCRFGLDTVRNCSTWWREFFNFAKSVLIVKDQLSNWIVERDILSSLAFYFFDETFPGFQMAAVLVHKYETCVKFKRWASKFSLFMKIQCRRRFNCDSTHRRCVL